MSEADILSVPVSQPVVAETTALGAAYAAGYAGWKKAVDRTLEWVDVG